MDMLEEENTEDLLWSKEGWDMDEEKLMSRINRACGHQVADRQLFALKYFAENEACYSNFTGKSLYSNWMSDKRMVKKKLDEGSIRAMDDFSKLIDESQMEKLDATDEGGMALMEEHKKGMAAKKATKVNG